MMYLRKRGSVLHLATTAVLLILLNINSAKALQDEKAVGISFGLLLPNYESPSDTWFTLASYYVGLGFSFGVLDDLWLTAEFGFSSLRAKSRGYSLLIEGFEQAGTLNYSTRMYCPSIGAKYLLFGGYDLQPFVSASIGYVFNSYHQNYLTDDLGQKYDVEIKDFAEDTFLLTIGISVEYRFLNTALIGAGVHLSTALGDEQLYQFSLSFPVYLAYYWP